MRCLENPETQKYAWNSKFLWRWWTAGQPRVLQSGMKCSARNTHGSLSSLQRTTCHFGCHLSGQNHPLSDRELSSHSDTTVKLCKNFTITHCINSPIFTSAKENQPVVTKYSFSWWSLATSPYLGLGWDWSPPWPWRKHTCSAHRVCGMRSVYRPGQWGKGRPWIPRVPTKELTLK